MGYIKVKYQKILNAIDCDSHLPNKWDKFIEKQYIKQNLIIKTTGKCTCTNCNYTWKSIARIGQNIKCPNCKNKYLVKRSNLRSFYFKDYVSLLEKVNNTLILRYFEVHSCYNATSGYYRSTVEFAREDIEEYDEVFVNERVSKCQCHIYISHISNADQWRLYTRNYKLIYDSIIYPYNLKEILTSIDAYKYSYIWELVKHFDYLNFKEILSTAKAYKSMEFLIKMKLYKLAFAAKYFGTDGNFEKRFKLTKDFYPFMKNHNITYEQLQVLRLLKEKDMQKVKYLQKYSLYDIEEISQYINLNRFIKYSKMMRKKVETYLYKDYLRFASGLGLDLKNNKYAFPKNLREEHDKLEIQFKLKENKELNKKIVNRGKELQKNVYSNKDFIVLPAKNFKALLIESKQQNNCVRTYADKYAEGKCDIYFMRNVNNKNQSLVTVEVRDNKIVQSRIKNNHQPDEKQLNFLKKWEKEILGKVA